MSLPLVDRALDRLHLRRAPGRPKQIHLSVIDRCFLPCLHCDIWKNEGEDLPTEVWEDVIDRLAQWCSPAAMNFVGGEPLMRTDLESLMGRAVDRGFEVSFNTNAWLVNKKRARRLSDVGVSIAYISMDGIHEETVDHSRNKAGSWKKAMAAIEHFGELPNPRVVIATILHKDNAAEMPELLDFVRSRGIQVVLQPLYQNFGDNTYDPHWYEDNHLFPRTDEELAAVHRALDLFSAERFRGGPVCNSIEQLQAMKQHFAAPGVDNGQMCRAGHSDLSFDPQGRVRLCYFLEPVGSIFDTMPLQALWDSHTTLRRRWEVSRCDRHCNLLNCNFERSDL